MKIRILGCGTSGGVPRLGGTEGGYWGVCDPKEPKNRRMRCSILVASRETFVLVDTTPDLRQQCLSAGVRNLDGVLYTHEHADHVNGIDDLRGFKIASGKCMPCYGEQRALDEITKRFGYIFTGSEGYPAIAEALPIEGPFRVGDIKIQPVRQKHGTITSLGYRFGDIAYSTDLDDIDSTAKAGLSNLDIWIVDALRREPHPTHAHLEKTLSWIEELKPRRAILTHMTWEMDYATLLKELPFGVEPAFDGLVIDTD